MDTTHFDLAAEYSARLAEVTAQRDALLAALEGLEARVSEMVQDQEWNSTWPEHDTARAAIAAAKGEA